MIAALYAYAALEVALMALFVCFVAYTTLAPVPADQKED